MFSSRTRRIAGLALQHLGAVAFLHLSTSPLPVQAAEPPGVASLIIDLKTGATLSAEQPDVMSRAVLPGSVMKVAAVAAALEHGLISARTRILCTRTVVVDGHRLTCTHPDLHRPLTAAEALAHSCNVYVASFAAKLPRSAFDLALTNLGLPPSGAASVPASALGIEGVRVVPRELVGALARIAKDDRSPAWKPATLAVIREGLRDAALRGTASALGEAGIDALAKTGTVVSGGVSQGLVVGVTPPVNPTRGFALIVSGGAGVNAAALAAARLRVHVTPAKRAEPAAPGAASIRVGVATADGRYGVRDVLLEDYVAGVVAGEQAAGSPNAALDALAIAVRTYALANTGRHRTDGFDLCDLTHCQVFRSPSAVSRAAAQRTAGRYLASGDAPAQVFYTASCGGHTERPSLVWRNAADPEHLPSRADAACEQQPEWRSEIAARDLLRALHTAGFSGDTIRGLRIAQRTPSGRAQWLVVDGMAPAQVSGENLRTIVGRVLGWQVLRSTLFDVTRTGSGFLFTGSGSGHGVGLCVLGASNGARRGEDVETILERYYPGLRLRGPGTARTAPAVPRPAASLRLQLPREDEPGRTDLERLATRLLAQVRAKLGGDAPSSLLLRFHPTVESYQRASGSPWFSTGSTSGRTLDFVPLRVLRQRDLLESTLRHELAHAVTYDALNGAPRWMYEGVAEWAAREPDAPLSPPALPLSCPSDEEFSRATSGDGLALVYARARACYERELSAGRSWRR